MLSFKNCCINGIIQYVTFGDWRFLPKVHVSMICSSYCWVVLHIMNVLQWNYSSIDGHLGFFQFGAVMNKAAMTYAWKYISVSLGEMSELKISGFYDSCLFCFIRNCEIFPEGLVYHFTFPPAVYEGSTFSTFLPALVSFFDYSHSNDVTWYLIMVLIYIFLLTNDVEHLFMCLLGIYISSLEKYTSVQIYCPFFFVFLFFLLYIFYWNIVELQCFRCRPRWFSYTYMHRLFFRLFSILGYYKILYTTGNY